MSARYEYVHAPGYGREDHLADELIARAARQLGLTGAGPYIAACVGLVSHPVPMGSARVSLPVARGIAVRMRAALRRARREFRYRSHGPDCCVYVAKVEVAS